MEKGVLTEGVLAPAGGDAAIGIGGACPGEADEADVIGEAEGAGQLEDGHVVVEGAVVEAGVRDDLGHSLLLVRQRLRFVARPRVPLARPDLQIRRPQLTGNQDKMRGVQH